MTVRITGILMPPSLKPFSGFIISTGDTNFYEIEKTALPVLTNTEPGTEQTYTGQG